jgi:hypothetical protein
VLLLGPAGGSHQLSKGRRRPRQEIGSPVEHADVHEPRQRKQGVPPPIRDDGGRKECGGVRLKSVQREDPTGRRELWGPDRIELEDIGVAGAGIEPLDIQLMPLIGGIGRVSADDTDSGVLGVEPLELPVEDLGLGAEGAAWKGDNDRPVVGLAGASEQEQDGKQLDAPVEHCEAQAGGAAGPAGR